MADDSGHGDYLRDELGEDLVLADLVSRVLDRGVLVRGSVVISVAGIDLIELGLDLQLTSTETSRRRRSIPPGGTGGRLRAERPTAGPAGSDDDASGSP